MGTRQQYNYALDAYQKHRLPLDEDCDAFAGLVCTVTKKWHEIAIGCPSLWRRINVTCVISTTLALRLKRSKTLGIDIYADWGQFHSFEEIEETMNIILPYMGRWTSLYVNCSGLLPFHDVLGITRWENRDTVSQEIRSLQVSMLVGEAPRLQHLAIIAVRSGPFSFNFGLWRLTE